MKNQKREGKMCKNKEDCDNGGYKHNYLCPKNTNSRCQIITPKKKVKKLFNMGTGEEYVRIKGRAWMDFWQKGELNGCKVKDMGATFLGREVPCVILIDRKYIGGKK